MSLERKLKNPNMRSEITKNIEVISSPIRAYHASDASFSEFKESTKRREMGVHFGTISQAIARMESLKVPLDKAYLYEVELSLNRVLVTSDFIFWNPTHIYEGLLEDFNYEIGMDTGYLGSKVATKDSVYQFLKDFNINGFKYLNEYEKIDSEEYSYLVFFLKDIKILNVKKGITNE